MYRPHLVPLQFPLLGLWCRCCYLLVYSARKIPRVRHVINSTNNLKNMVQVQRLEMSRDDFVVGALNHCDVGSQFRRRGRCIIMT